MSGFCCRRGPCAFGEWDDEKKQCSFLIDKEDGTTRCGKYEEIINLPKPEWYWNPAFGAGCCATLFNEARERILKQMSEQSTQLRDVTPEEVKASMEAAGITVVPHHNCGICNYETAYHVIDGGLVFDHGCHCTGQSNGNYSRREWSSISDWINMQSKDDNKRSLAAKVGITL
jgi:hypothetical protein